MIAEEGGTMRVIYTRILITGVLIAALTALGTFEHAEAPTAIHAAAHP